MISCAFALIFLTTPDNIYDKSPLETPNKFKPWKQVPHLNRLVLLSGGYKKSFYGAYKIGDNERFPRIQVGDDIFMTADQKTDSPTKLRAYCSPTLSSTEIVKILSRNLDPNSKFYYPKLNGHELSSEKCLKAIKKEWDGTENKYASQKQIITQSSTCSNSDIIGLAFQGEISVIGGYTRYAPSNNQELPLVTFENTLELENLVSERQLYAAWKKNGSQMVLVWYYGQLHLFKRIGDDKLWWPVTDLNNLEKNGATILSFLRNRLRLSQELDKQIGRYPWTHAFTDLLKSAPNPNQADKRGEVYRLMAEVSHVALKVPEKVPISL
ncbi:Blumeria specific protein, partial [Blumeria hordei DH14]